MMELSHQQKAVALRSLVGMFRFALRLNDNGSWLVELGGLDYRGDGFITSPGAEFAPTPAEAIEAAWARVTATPKDKTQLYVTPFGGGEAYPVRWNGFMWERIPENRQQAG